ncbi:hypothetical protein AB3N59_11665 [Leptospira sp. WS92.C1]
MKFLISCSFVLFSITACSEAARVSLDSSNPLALLGQIGWSLNAVPNTQFMAVGERCSLLTSSDGITWNYSADRFPGCNQGTIRSVAYGNGVWVAVGTKTLTGLSCGIWSSHDDGETWSLYDCAPKIIAGTPVIKNLRVVTYGGDRFWAAGDHNGSGTGTDFFGQISSDGTNWSYLGIDDGSSYIDTDSFYSASYNAIRSEIYFGGTHSVNAEIVKMAVPSLAQSSVSLSTLSFKNRVLALKSGNVLVYGDNHYATSTSSVTRFAPNLDAIAVATQFTTAIQQQANTAVEGKDKILLLGNQCSMDYYEFGLNVWHPGSGITLSGCSTNHLNGSAYNSVLDRYVAVGNSNFFGHSTTGLPSTWTAASPDIGGGTPLNLLAVASK